jgi:O-antigen ligase
VGDSRLRALAWVALVAGVVGFVLGGASAGVVGLLAAGVVACAAAARRGLAARRALAASAAAVLVASVGVVALRSTDFSQFSRFLGIRQSVASTSKNVQTYSQHTLLAYIGFEIWLHHPLIGVGWQGAGQPFAFGPELPKAHRHFPDVPPLGFPSVSHPYSPQTLYVEILSDLGVVGFVLFAALVVAALFVGLRSALRAPPYGALVALVGVGWFLLALGFWGAEGLIGGFPLEAMTWLALGLVCVPPSTGERAVV